MYISVGGKKAVREKTVIGIFDLDGKITTADTAAYLRAAERRGEVTLAGEDLPKCFVLTDEGVIFSHLSVKALTERGNSPMSL